MKYYLYTSLFIFFPLMAIADQDQTEENEGNHFTNSIFATITSCENSKSVTVLFKCYTNNLKMHISQLRQAKPPINNRKKIFADYVFLLKEANACFVNSQSSKRDMQDVTPEADIETIEHSYFFACILQDVHNLHMNPYTGFGSKLAGFLNTALSCESSNKSAISLFKCYANALEQNINKLLLLDSEHIKDTLQDYIILLKEANGCFVLSQSAKKDLMGITEPEIADAVGKSHFFTCIIEDIGRLDIMVDHDHHPMYFFGPSEDNELNNASL